MLGFYTVHLFRLLLPLLFIKLFSSFFESVMVSWYLEILLNFQLVLLITECGLSISGPLILEDKKLSSVGMLPNILLIQFLLGFFSSFVIMIIYEFDIVIVFACIAGLFQGMHLTWYYKAKIQYESFVKFEISFRIILYSVMTIALLSKSLELIFLINAIISLMWFLFPVKKVNFNFISVRLLLNLKKQLLNGFLFKSSALTVYPLSFLFFSDRLFYESFNLFKLDKIMQVARGALSPMVDYFFPKKVAKKASRINEYFLIIFSMIISLLLYYFYPLAYEFLFNEVFVDNNNLRIFFSLIPFINAFTHLAGTLKLVTAGHINIYLVAIFTSIIFTFSFGFIIDKSIIQIWVIVPYFSLLVFLLIFNFFKSQLK